MYWSFKTKKNNVKQNETNKDKFLENNDKTKKQKKKRKSLTLLINIYMIMIYIYIYMVFQILLRTSYWIHACFSRKCVCCDENSLTHN